MFLTIFRFELFQHKLKLALQRSVVALTIAMKPSVPFLCQPEGYLSGFLRESVHKEKYGSILQDLQASCQHNSTDHRQISLVETAGMEYDLGQEKTPWS
jgi:hypothetical protein